jgi:Holliday junction resolvasome RuvABC DNA-binding subunit
MAKNQDKTEKEILLEISVKLDKLIGVMATQGKSKEEQVKVLVALGFSNSEISGLTAMPRGTVCTIRANLRKK